MKSILVVVVFTLIALCGFVSPIQAQTKIFSDEELATFNGVGDNKAYYAFEGKVYDVTGSRLWKEGEHFGLKAGTDLTGKLDGAPHGTEVFAGFTVVGTYGNVPISSNDPQTSTPTVALAKDSTPQPRPWYAQPIRIAGISILGWTGILLGIVFVLNFATCFALPWSTLQLPWMGKRPGSDPLDSTKIHLKWSALHRYFAWATVLFGILHGIIGLLQLIGIYL